MNDQRDKRFVQRSIDEGLSSVQGDPWLAQRIMASEKGENKVKKKTTLSVVMVVVAILAIATVAIAEIVGINVFELFGTTDKRYAKLAPYTILKETSEVSISRVELGDTTASINSAYYDGESLIVAYAIENDSRVSQFQPDETLFAKMSKTDPEGAWPDTMLDYMALMEQYYQARSQGEPFGIVSYAVLPSDHTVTDDNVEIMPSMESLRLGDDGVTYRIREYETLLGTELQNRDSLSISIGLCLSTSYVYFDGTDTYTYNENTNLEPMTATIWNAHPEINTFSGTGQFRGVSFEATVRASAANAIMTVVFPDGPLPLLPDEDDQWYELKLFDENNQVLLANNAYDGGETEVTRTYQGTGTLPKELKLIIFIENEGEFDWEAALNNGEAIVLTLQK